jgi:hypothetical protein
VMASTCWLANLEYDSREQGEVRGGQGPWRLSGLRYCGTHPWFLESTSWLATP